MSVEVLPLAVTTCQYRSILVVLNEYQKKRREPLEREPAMSGCGAWHS